MGIESIPDRNLLPTPSILELELFSFLARGRAAVSELQIASYHAKGKGLLCDKSCPTFGIPWSKLMRHRTKGEDSSFTSCTTGYLILCAPQPMLSGTQRLCFRPSFLDLWISTLANLWLYLLEVPIPDLSFVLLMDMKMEIGVRKKEEEFPTSPLRFQYRLLLKNEPSLWKANPSFFLEKLWLCRYPKSCLYTLTKRLTFIH